jgi:hypothetical protein
MDVLERATNFNSETRTFTMDGKVYCADPNDHSRFFEVKSPKN